MNIYTILCAKRNKLLETAPPGKTRRQVHFWKGSGYEKIPYTAFNHFYGIPVSLP
jgi:hypothetical protein